MNTEKLKRSPIKLEYLSEPKLEFGHGQELENPKDGLFLFGPLATNTSPSELRIGVVSHPNGLVRYKRWVKKISGYIPAEREEATHHASFPGFESVFGCKWPETPICTLEVSEDSIKNSLYLDDKYEAIYKAVELYVDKIKSYIREEDFHVDIWFVVIPEEIYTYGRPKSVVPKELRVKSERFMNYRTAKELQQSPDLFSEHNEAAEVYKYELHFHNQLKARLLEDRAVVQVVRETSLTPEDFLRDDGQPIRRTQDPASLAWNLTTTTFFKGSGRPWKLANVREGVCYLGLVFKIDHSSLTENNACCGAQLFLDSGDGLVFKGAVGPWYSEDTKEFHLPYSESKKLITSVLNAYKSDHGYFPKELFIHGRTRFSDEEWLGFTEETPAETNIVGVRIREDKSIKMYGEGDEPILRGMGYLRSRRRGHLWTRGFIPRLRTYPGREVPNPLFIEICRGEANLETVMKDILGLTKVNFNSCIYADGKPVTLRFADAVGDILTATPEAHKLPPLPFKHYI